MGNYKQHILFGIFSSALIILLLQFLQLIVLTPYLLIKLMIVSLMFSLLPDIDHRASHISRFLHITSAIVALALFTKNLTFNYSSALMIISIAGLETYHLIYSKNSSKHRQFPHTFTFGLLTSSVLFLITFSWPIVLIATSAFVSHLALDNYILEALKQDLRFWKIKK